MVASLPEHHHLFAESGCDDGKKKNPITGKMKVVKRRCKTGTKKQIETESALPDSFLPIRLDPSMDTAWDKLIYGDAAKEKSGNKTK